MDCRCFAAVLVAAILLGGCSRLSTNTRGSDVAVGGVEAAPLEVDIKVGEKISGSCIYKALFGIPLEAPGRVAYGAHVSPDPPGSRGECLNGAIYQAITAANADVIIAPRYFLDEFKLLCLPFLDACVWRSQDMQVTGYKGTYNGFKKVDPELRKYRALSSAGKGGGQEKGEELFLNRLTNLFSR